MMKVAHQPVMLQEACEGLAIKPDGVYVDATFGRGGHARAILAQLNEQGRLFAYDKDLEAVEHAKKNISDTRFSIQHDSFVQLGADLSAQGVAGQVDGVLMDLGVSSPQLDQPERGFSFMSAGPLDMRMNLQQSMTAADWLATASEKQIADVLYQYGEERLSRKIAAAIAHHRTHVEPITTTDVLADIIKQAVGPHYQREKHPATRSFQALRIKVNSELDELQVCLDGVIDLLAIGGRLVVISFHSLEHRIIRKSMQRYLPGNESPTERLSLAQTPVPRLKRIGRTLTASANEQAVNVRSRSAQCRIVEKIAC